MVLDQNKLDLCINVELIDLSKYFQLFLIYILLKNWLFSEDERLIYVNCIRIIPLLNKYQYQSLY